MSKKIMTQADIDAVKPDKNGVMQFGDCCNFGDCCKFGNGCKFGIDMSFGLRPTFGERCCFCAPMTYIEYVERTNRKTNHDDANGREMEDGDE